MSFMPPHLLQAIITTRNKTDFDNYKQKVELTAFKPTEGKTYIKECLESSLCQPSNKDIEALIQEVGLIPQNLALAVGYIKMPSNAITTIQQYIDELQALKDQGIKKRGKLVLPEAKLGLKKLDAVSQQLMRYGAYLDPDFIPTSLLISLLKIDSREGLSNILAPLEKLSLITIIRGQWGELGIQIHREIQKACRDYADWHEGATIPQETLLLNILEVLYE
ncbi:hypothetical protein GR268_43430, partial [Rhizobium leguminosarum]|nr:hypothetical protein [Rhizobium leguminosarum]